jgi:hypothetical protein
VRQPIERRSLKAFSAHRASHVCHQRRDFLMTAHAKKEARPRQNLSSPDDLRVITAARRVIKRRQTAFL